MAPEDIEPLQAAAAYRDRTIDLLTLVPVDSLMVVRGDFEILVSRKSLVRLLEDTTLFPPRTHSPADTILAWISEDLRNGRMPILRATEGGSVRWVEDWLVDSLLQQGQGYLRDRVGRREFTFVFTSGTGRCPTDFGRFYWVSDGRKVFEAHPPSSWCPEP